MASPIGHASIAVNEEQSLSYQDKVQAMQTQPWDYGFFATVRWFETQHPELARVAEAPTPRLEPVRLGQAPKLAFSPATLSALETHPRGGSKVVSQFAGLLGPQGPLPLHITEYIFERVQHENDETLVAFLDIFHQRFLALFYRSWANAMPAVQLDRPGNDRFSRYVTSLSGVGTETFDNVDCLPSSAKRRFAGLFGHQRKDAESLAAIVSGYFDVPAAVVELVGDWLEIPSSEHCRLGHSASVASLGESATLGGRYWNVQSRFTLRLGPLGLEDFNRFLPKRRSYDRLMAAVRNFTHDEFSWDLQLVVKADEVPQASLGGDDPNADSVSRLGWNSWLGQDNRQQPAEDAVLQSRLDRALVPA